MYGMGVDVAHRYCLNSSGVIGVLLMEEHAGEGGRGMGLRYVGLGR